MDIINIITTENNIVLDIKSFPIIDENYEGNIIDLVENEFKNIINTFSCPYNLTQDEINTAIDQGFNYKGFDVSIIRSTTN